MRLVATTSTVRGKYAPNDNHA